MIYYDSIQLSRHFNAVMVHLFISYQYNIYNLNNLQMANQSAKKNEKSIRPIINIVTMIVYGLIGFFSLIHGYYLLNYSISIFHFLAVLIVDATSYFCLNQMIKCWELDLPTGAADYYIDVLALNCIVMLISPFTSYIWYIYWLIVVFVLWILGKWAWSKITPSYEENDQETDGKQGKKKQKKQKKEKIKYIKK